MIAKLCCCPRKDDLNVDVRGREGGGVLSCAHFHPAAVTIDGQSR